MTVRQGRLAPLHGAVSATLAAHASPVLGVRWLGATPRVVSFSTEKLAGAAGGYRNTLLITDMRSRLSAPLREQPADAAPVLAVRAAPSGRHLLVIFRQEERAGQAEGVAGADVGLPRG